MEWGETWSSPAKVAALNFPFLICTGAAYSLESLSWLSTSADRLTWWVSRDGSVLWFRMGGLFGGTGGRGFMMLPLGLGRDFGGPSGDGRHFGT